MAAKTAPGGIEGAADKAASWLGIAMYRQPSKGIECDNVDVSENSGTP